MAKRQAGDRSSGESVGSEYTHTTARQIARIAAQLFAERGFDTTPVRAIAEAVGVSCPTLYYHFGNKEGLAQELLIRPLRALVESLRVLVGAEGLDPITRLERLVNRQLDFSREDPMRARFVYAVIFGPSDRTLASEVDRILRELTGLDHEAVGRLAEMGLVPRDRVGDFASALRGQIVIRTVDFLYRGGALGPTLAGQIVCDLLLGYAEPGARDRLVNRYRSCDGAVSGPEPPSAPAIAETSRRQAGRRRRNNGLEQTAKR